MSKTTLVDVIKVWALLVKNFLGHGMVNWMCYEWPTCQLVSSCLYLVKTSTRFYRPLNFLELVSQWRIYWGVLPYKGQYSQENKSHQYYSIHATGGLATHTVLRTKPWSRVKWCFQLTTVDFSMDCCTPIKSFTKSLTLFSNVVSKLWQLVFCRWSLVLVTQS